MSTQNQILAGILVTLGLLVMAPLSLATEIHKWVDKEGITHYSEEPPANEQLPAQRVELLEEYTDSNPKESDEDYYSVVNQARRLEASRLAREESRRKDRELDLQQNALQAERTPPVAVDTQQDDRYYPVFYPGNRIGRFQGKPDFHGKRGHYDEDRRYGKQRGESSRNRADRSKQSRRSGSAFKPSTYQGK